MPFLLDRIKGGLEVFPADFFKAGMTDKHGVALPNGGNHLSSYVVHKWKVDSYPKAVKGFLKTIVSVTLGGSQRSPQRLPTLLSVFQLFHSLCVETALSSCLSKKGAFAMGLRNPVTGSFINVLSEADEKAQDPGGPSTPGAEPRQSTSPGCLSVFTLQPLGEK